MRQLSAAIGQERPHHLVRRADGEWLAAVADPGGGDTDAMMSKIELFGKTVLPRIREI